MHCGIWDRVLWNWSIMYLSSYSFIHLFIYPFIYFSSRSNIQYRWQTTQPTRISPQVVICFHVRDRNQNPSDDSGTKKPPTVDLKPPAGALHYVVYFGSWGNCPSSGSHTGNASRWRHNGDIIGHYHIDLGRGDHKYRFIINTCVEVFGMKSSHKTKFLARPSWVVIWPIGPIADQNGSCGSYSLLVAGIRGYPRLDEYKTNTEKIIQNR